MFFMGTNYVYRDFLKVYQTNSEVSMFSKAQQIQKKYNF